MSGAVLPFGLSARFAVTGRWRRFLPAPFFRRGIVRRGNGERLYSNVLSVRASLS